MTMRFKFPSHPMVYLCSASSPPRSFFRTGHCRYRVRPHAHALFGRELRSLAGIAALHEVMMQACAKLAGGSDLD